MTLRRILATAVTGSLLTLSACGQDGEPGSSESEIVIGVSAPAAVLLVPFLAEKEGLFDEAGLDVQVKLVPGPQLPAALASGAVNLAVSSAPALDAAALSAPIKVIGTWATDPDMQLVAAEGIDSLAELEGKRFGVGAKGTNSAILASVALAEADLASDDVKNVVADLSAIASLMPGQVDAIVLAPPLTQVVMHNAPGSTILHDFKGLPWTMAEIAGEEGWLKDNEEQVVDALRAMDEALEFWVSDPTAAKAVISEVTKIADDKVLEDAYQSAVRSFTDGIQPVPVEVQENVLELLKEYGDVADAGPDKGDQVLDSSYAEQLD